MNSKNSSMLSIEKIAAFFGIVGVLIAIYQFIKEPMQPDKVDSKLIITSEELNDENQFDIIIQNNEEYAVTVNEAFCSSTREFENQSAKVTLFFVSETEVRIAPTTSRQALFSLNIGAKLVDETEPNAKSVGNRDDNCFIDYNFRDSEGEVEFKKIQFFTNEMECWVGSLADNTLADHSDYFRKQLEDEESC